jgi:hypothetical protein
VKPIILANDKLEFTISPMGGRLIRSAEGWRSDQPHRGHQPLFGFGWLRAHLHRRGCAGHAISRRSQSADVRCDCHQRAGAFAFGDDADLAASRARNFTRTIEVVNGENIVYVTSDLERR